MNELGVQTVVSSKLSGVNYKLQGKTFVLTGELKSFTRDEAKDIIRKAGGDISSSVSKKTDFVLAGENPGSKYNKAKELGVKKADAFISADGGLRIYMKSGSKTPNESRLNKLGLQKVSVKGVAVNLAGRQTFGDERARARKRRGKKLSGPAG